MDKDRAFEVFMRSFEELKATTKRIAEEARELADLDRATRSKLAEHIDQTKAEIRAHFERIERVREALKEPDREKRRRLVREAWES